MAGLALGLLDVPQLEELDIAGLVRGIDKCTVHKYLMQWSEQIDRMNEVCAFGSEAAESDGVCSIVEKVHFGMANFSDHCDLASAD